MSISRFSSLLAFTLLTVAACGSEGPAGEMGDPGPMGTMGNPGAPGTPGQDGDNGTNGTNGAAGANGNNGTNGLACWDLNSNAACDVGTEDTSGDAACTVIDCRGSQGPQGPAGATAGQAAGTALGSALLTLAPDDVAAIPGLSIGVTVPAVGQYVALISTHGTGAIADVTPDTFAAVTVFVQMDAAALPGGGGVQNMVMFNGVGGGEGLDHWSISTVTPLLAAGAHTVSVAAANNVASVSDVEVSGNSTSGFRGAVSVLLLKL